MLLNFMLISIICSALLWLAKMEVHPVPCVWFLWLWMHVCNILIRFGICQRFLGLSCPCCELVDGFLYYHTCSPDVFSELTATCGSFFSLCQVLYFWHSRCGWCHSSCNHLPWKTSKIHFIIVMGGVQKLGHSSSDCVNVAIFGISCGSASSRLNLTKLYLWSARPQNHAVISIS